MDSFVSVRIWGLTNHFLLPRALKEKARCSVPAVAARLSRCKLVVVGLYVAVTKQPYAGVPEDGSFSQPPIKPFAVLTSQKRFNESGFIRDKVLKQSILSRGLCG